MRRHGNLFDQVVSFENLFAAAKQAFQGKRANARVAPFYFNLETEILALQEELTQERYKPHPYGIFEIREPKIRQICSSHFRDRVVHHAICRVLDPLVDRRLIFDTYACRRNKGSHAAVERARVFVTRSNYFLKCDIKKYFPSIDHAILKGQLRRVLKDRRLLILLDIIIDHQVPGNLPGKGLPIGNLTSQYFANLYLSPFDHYFREHRRVKHYLRYMDDFILFDDDKERLRDALFDLASYLQNNLDLQLKESATKLAPVTDGVPFLGFRIFRNLVRLQRPNLIRFRRQIHRRESAYLAGWIGEQELVQSVSSMVAHIRHANSMAVRRKEFEGSFKLA